jgi:hypothetical protein
MLKGQCFDIRVIALDDQIISKDLLNQENL